MLLIDNDDELPAEPQEDEARFSAELGTNGVDSVDAALTVYAGHHWLKSARIIHDAIKSGGFTYSDGIVDFHARRLHVLVGAGVLEGRGNLRKPRYSEVRLPATAPRDEQLSSTSSASDEVILERRITLHIGDVVHPVLVRIRRPDSDPLPSGNWRCRFSIDGLPDREPIEKASFGVDPMQAAILTLHHVRLELRLLQADGLDLRWLGMSDLGFPSSGLGEPTVDERRRRR